MMTNIVAVSQRPGQTTQMGMTMNAHDPAGMSESRIVGLAKPTVADGVGARIR